jgi:hypothetical protein
MFSFACHACSLSSVAHDKCVATSNQGDAISTENRGGAWEKWIVIPTAKATFVLQNSTHGHFLASNGEGSVVATSYEKCLSAEWLIQPLSTESSQYVIRTVAHGKNITCNDVGDMIHTSSDGDNISWCNWNLEIQMGELCFLSSFSVLPAKQIKV